MSEATAAVALLVVAAGLVVAVGVAVVWGLRQAVTVLLDFLLAAGLLRLSHSPDWEVVGATAAVVAVRQLLGTGLRVGLPSAQEMLSARTWLRRRPASIARSPTP